MEAEHAERQEARRKAQATQERLLQCGIPERYAESTLGNYAADLPGQSRALRTATGYVEAFPNRGASMVFCGKPGTGKTHLACAVARCIAERGHTARFETVLSAIRSIKDTYRRDSESSESQAIAALISPALLVLDEVGAQLGSEHEKILLFEIINERYQECRSTILISNLTIAELTTYLGDRAIDRFREGGAVLAFDWDSHRGVRHG